MRRDDEAAQPARPAEAEGGEDVGQRLLERGDRFRAGVERLQRVDQDDLPVEAGEVLAEEGPHHRGLIGLVAAGHHRGERAVRDRAVAEIERREGEGRRAVEIAGHQEAAGRQRREAGPVGADGAEIFGEQGRKLAGERLVFGRSRVRPRPAARASAPRAPAGRGCGPRSRSRATRWRSPWRGGAGRGATRRDSRRCRDGCGRCRSVRVRKDAEFVLDREAELADLPGRVRPDALVDQRPDVTLVVEARDRVVGLRLEPGAGDAAARIGLEERQAAAVDRGCGRAPR